MRVIRRLQGIAYWVVDDPKEIRVLVNTSIGKEWESDILDQGQDHEHGSWLNTLAQRKWQLRIVAMKDIKLGDEIMNYRNEKTGYSFRKRLKERKKILEREIDRFGAVLRPIVLRAEDRQLMDGYCRYHVFRDRKITRAYAYVGSL